MQIQNFRCSGCGIEGRGKIVPDNWLLWVPSSWTGENHNDLEERNGINIIVRNVAQAVEKYKLKVIKPDNGHDAL